VKEIAIHWRTASKNHTATAAKVKVELNIQTEDPISTKTA
jgi:hypothetical protein